MNEEEKRKKLLKWVEKEYGEKPVEEQDEEKLTEEEKAESYLKGQQFGESASIPRMEEAKIDPEKIKDRIIDDINEMSEHEQVLRQESERQIAELDEGIKDFMGFLEEVKNKVSEGISKAEKEGKLKAEEIEKLIMEEFQKWKKDKEEQSRKARQILKSIEESEAKRRKIIDRLDVEAEKLIAEQKKVVEENKREVARVRAENKKVEEKNEKILAENEEIREKNKRILEHNRRLGMKER